MNEIKYFESQEWRQEPDCYSGPKCDQQRPRWMTSYPKEGEEEVGEILELKIPAAMCPPGTRIIIKIPVCPKCGDLADTSVSFGAEYKTWPKCDCGFSWKKWAEERYS